MFFDKDIPVLTPGRIFKEEPLIAPVITSAALYWTDSIFFRKTMRWKIDHKWHPHNQGEVLSTIYK